MKLTTAVAWLAVAAAIILAVVLRLIAERSNWVLAVILVPAFLLAGYLLGGSDDNEPETSGRREE